MGIELEGGQRAIAVGMTGTGKSTLCTEIIRRFQRQYPNGRVVAIDSKPRYRALYNSRGMKMKYTNWVDGDVLRNSVGVTEFVDLKQMWKLAQVVIVQSMTSDGRQVAFFEDLAAQYAQSCFQASGKRLPTLLYIDEYYDLLGGGLAATMDRRLLRTIRAGRERNMNVLVAAQRPKSIPLPTLTEASKMFIFYLEYEEDTVYMRKHGPQLSIQPSGYSFVLYERRGTERDERLMELSLGSTS